MNQLNNLQIDPKLDLVLERVVDVPPALVWAAWTTPEHLMKWFTPKPWDTVECEIDLRPGGKFRTVMRSPEGENFPNIGCYLEIIPEKKLVWTDALLPGYRPAISQEGSCGITAFTGMILLEPEGKGTKYTAVAIHKSEEERKKHEEMGFHQGWGAALDQLVALFKK
ncbi:MAG: SRPBCC family protein [Verrucomicrobiota bacterium]|nr:SRPBCC family protein [Verrucomicrobiota bacterium]